MPRNEMMNLDNNNKYDMEVELLMVDGDFLSNSFD